MQQPRITLQIAAQVDGFVDDALHIINSSIVIATTEIKRGNLIIENKDAVLVEEQRILFKLFFYIGNKRKSFRKRSTHKMPVDLRLLNGNKYLHPEIIVMLHCM